MKKGKNLKRIAPATKIVNGKRVPVCNHGGICKNKAFREVYPSLSGGKHKDKGWSYLCKKHFEQEKRRFKGKLPSCSI